MYKELRSCVVLLCLVQVILCQNQDDSLTNRATNNELQCYVCEETNTQACGDPIDKTYLELHACNTLDYGHQQPRRDGTKLVPVSPLLKDIFGIKERLPNRITFEYECIKYEEKNGVERSCIQKPANIEDACDFFKQEKPELQSCHTCNTDDCNGSSSSRQSVLFLAATILMLWKFY